MKRILALYGAGGLGREMLVLAKIINKKETKWDQIVFIDDNKHNRKLESIDVLSFEELVEQSKQDETEAIVAIGEPSIKEKLSKKIMDNGIQLGTLIHPDVYIPENTTVGKGTIICQGSYISCNVSIGENVLIQPLASIGHDCIIGNNSVISTFVTLAGACQVGNSTYIGMSVPVKEKTIIGNGAIVGMGSAVFRDIDDNVIALGNPARAMKKNIEKRVFK